MQEDVKNRIKRVMLEEGLSERDVAARLGITAAGFNKIMHAKTSRNSTLKKIADVLGKPLSFFLGEDNSVNQQINGNSVNISQNLNQKNNSESNFEAEIKKELQMINLKLDLLLERSKDKKC